MPDTPVIDAHELHKCFGPRTAVHDASFRLERGQVLGLLGPNGAGKTTILRMLVGLIHPTGGSVRLFGHDVRRDFERALDSVGAIVETPDMYKFLTGRQNLAQYARMRPDIGPEHISETIRFVELTDRIDERITRYSLGMRQRLGIAQALLHQPRLLILDEPTNGLDPAGMQDLRVMIRRLADEQGMAVLISSHLLHDVQAVCDSLVVLKEGHVIAAGDTASFLHTPPLRSASPWTTLPAPPRSARSRAGASRRLTPKAGPSSLSRSIRPRPSTNCSSAPASASPGLRPSARRSKAPSSD